LKEAQAVLALEPMKCLIQSGLLLKPCSFGMTNTMDNGVPTTEYFKPYWFKANAGEQAQTIANCPEHSKRDK